MWEEQSATLTFPGHCRAPLDIKPSFWCHWTPEIFYYQLQLTSYQPSWKDWCFKAEAWSQSTVHFGIHKNSSYGERFYGTHHPSCGLFISTMYMSVYYTSHPNHCTPNTIRSSLWDNGAAIGYISNLQHCNCLKCSWHNCEVHNLGQTAHMCKY